MKPGTTKKLLIILAIGVVIYFIVRAILNGKKKAENNILWIAQMQYIVDNFCTDLSEGGVTIRDITETDVLTPEQQNAYDVIKGEILSEKWANMTKTDIINGHKYWLKTQATFFQKMFLNW